MLGLPGLYLTGFTCLPRPSSASATCWRIRPPRGASCPRSVGRRCRRHAVGSSPAGSPIPSSPPLVTSGSGARGAGLMLASDWARPNLLLAWHASAFPRHHHPRVRLAPALVLGFGVFGLYHAPSLSGDLWRGVVCVTWKARRRVPSNHLEYGIDERNDDQVEGMSCGGCVKNVTGVRKGLPGGDVRVVAGRRIRNCTSRSRQRCRSGAARGRGRGLLIPGLIRLASSGASSQCKTLWFPHVRRTIFPREDVWVSNRSAPARTC